MIIVVNTLSGPEWKRKTQSAACLRTHTFEKNAILQKKKKNDSDLLKHGFLYGPMDENMVMIIIWGN